MGRAEGFTTLTMTVLLAAILLSLSLLMAKVLLAERRLTVNELEYRLTQAAAEQGIAEAIARLKVEPHVQQLASTVTYNMAEVSYNVTMVPHTTLTGVRHLESVASLPSGASSRVRVALAERTILHPQHNRPVVSMQLGNNVRINGQLHVVAKGSGAGAASLWARNSLSIIGELHTCYAADYRHSTQRCVTSVSEYSAVTQTLKDDVRMADSTVPSDLLNDMFGYSESQWLQIVAMATAEVTDCQQIKRSGFYIVSGSGSCQLDHVISSRAAPVIILAKDTSITASNPTQFYGLLLVYQSATVTGQGGSITLANGSEIIGALVTGRATSQPATNENSLSGDFSVRYDADVLCTVSDCLPTAGPRPFVVQGVIAGSWQDN